MGILDKLRAANKPYKDRVIPTQANSKKLITVDGKMGYVVDDLNCQYFIKFGDGSEGFYFKNDKGLKV
tara:strand:+ start:232 stop:435 length:204 start_codon:yes stop_codon:yes gene_type:complete